MSVVATAMLGVIPVGLLFRAYEIGHRSYERIWLLQEEYPPRNAVTSETSLLPQCVTVISSLVYFFEPL